VTVFDRRPALRWLVPITAGAVIVAGAALGASGATADSGLPARSAADLLAALQEPTTESLSGTVVVTTDLGIPQLPGMAAGTGPASLVSGSHTLRVWADGPTRSRVAILGDAEEYVLVRDGDTAWAWSSADQTAVRLNVPAKATDPAATVPSDLPTTPQEAADAVLRAIDPSTEVTTTGVGSVAGRSVYELVLTPRQGDTRVARVTVAVDAETNVPLRVQVFSTQIGEPAIEVGFTSVDFATPDASLFAFTPPAGTEVAEKPSADDAGTSARPPVDEPTVVGEGWAQVVIATLPADAADAAGEAGTMPAGMSDVGAALGALPSVTGPWGTGRVLDGTLVSALLTDDGRIAIGAVSPQALADALAGS
jgi:outer membrane lipoprotein-sorting protein